MCPRTHTVCDAGKWASPRASLWACEAALNLTQKLHEVAGLPVTRTSGQLLSVRTARQGYREAPVQRTAERHTLAVLPSPYFPERVKNTELTAGYKTKKGKISKYLQTKSGPHVPGRARVWTERAGWAVHLGERTRDRGWGCGSAGRPEGAPSLAAEDARQSTRSPTPPPCARPKTALLLLAPSSARPPGFTKETTTTTRVGEKGLRPAPPLPDCSRVGSVLKNTRGPGLLGATTELAGTGPAASRGNAPPRLTGRPRVWYLRPRAGHNQSCEGAPTTPAGRGG